MKFLLVVLFSCLLLHPAIGQNCALSLTGHVDDTDTKEKLPNATIQLLEMGLITISNRDGDFAFDMLCPGTYTLQITHVHCDTLRQQIVLKQNFHEDFSLPHAKSTLGEVTVTTTVHPRTQGIAGVLNERELSETRGRSLAEVLSKINGVTMLQTGSTISKPVIQGLHGSRVLILNSGIRHEGQQWGNEHAPEIDPFIADRIVVVKGAASLKYGADAIGGAILVEPRTLPTAGSTNAEINTVYFSNNRQYVISAMVEQNLRNAPAFSWRLQGTYQRAGNSRTPDYWLYNTGFEEYNYSAMMGWRKQRFQSELFLSAFNTTTGIFMGSHIGNLTDLLHAISNEKPVQNIDEFSYSIDRPRQQVAHYLAKWRNTFNLSNVSRLNIVLAHQENFRKEFDRSKISEEPELNLNIGTTTVDASHEKTGKVSTTVGLSVLHQQNVWRGTRFFIPNFRLWNLAGYAIAKTAITNRLEAEAGLRFDYKTMDVYRNRSGELTEVGRTFSNLSASGVVTYRQDMHQQVLGTASFAWRAPQPNELYVNGLHHGTANFEIGDPNLESEKAINLGLQYRYNKDSSWLIDVNPYLKYIAGYIGLIPFSPPTLTLRGAYPTFRYVQTDALLYGADISIGKQFTRRWKSVAKASLLWAKDLKDKEWLEQVPAHRVEADVSYSFRLFHPLENYVQLQAVHVTRQTRIADNTGDYLAPPPAYTLLNLEIASMFHLLENRLSLGMSINNLLNTRYRDYMNRFRYFSDEPGRNIVIKLKYTL